MQLALRYLRFSHPTASMSFRRRPRAAPEHPGSHRWETTLSQDMSNVAKQLEGSDYYNTGLRKKSLNDRKLANSKTSISFGNEKCPYISDAMAHQRQAGEPKTGAQRAAEKQKQKEMKKALTTTNFVLGDEPTEYASANRDAMADGFKGYKRTEKNNDLKEAIKKSSLHFGNEKVNYLTVQQEATLPRKSDVDWNEQKQAIADMTASLRKHNFSFGEEKVEYLSDQTRGYGSVPIKAYSQRQEALPGIKATIQDSRSCHFSLGLDKVLYESNTHGGFKSVAGATPQELVSQRAALKKMKQALQTTSIVIGDDSEYM